MHDPHAETDLLRSIAAQLQGAGHGERAEILERATERLGCSTPTLYRKLQRVGWTSGRKLRTDRGESALTREETLAVAAIMRASRRANGKMLLPVEDALEIALANGQLRKRASPATVLRMMRAHGCHPSQMGADTAHTTMRSLHPNHVWQLDASVCVLYRIRGQGVAVMDQRKFNERKPRDLQSIINQRVLRYAVTDHASGAVYARYYEAAGEDQYTLFEFLMAAFQARAEGVMHGVPLMMVWDAGSANMAHGIRNLFTALAIDHWTHKPGQPRAKGQVEGVHNIIERKFEGRLSITRTDSVEQLNAQLDMWLADFNGIREHRRHGASRWAMWQTIRPDQLRLCPPIETCRALMIAKPQPRTVDGALTISYAVKGYTAGRYSVAHIADVRVGEQVMVAVNPYCAPNIYVLREDAEGRTRYIECEAQQQDRFGLPIDAPVWGEQYQRPAQRDVDRARGDVNALAYGERDTVDADNAKAKGRVAFDGAIDPFRDLAERAAQVPAHMQRRGTELHVPNPAQVEIKPMTLVEALFELRARLGRALTREESARVAELHPEGVPHEALDALTATILDPPVHTESRPRLVAIK